MIRAEGVVDGLGKCQLADHYQLLTTIKLAREVKNVFFQVPGPTFSIYCHWQSTLIDSLFHVHIQNLLVLYQFTAYMIEQ